MDLCIASYKSLIMRLNKFLRNRESLLLDSRPPVKIMHHKHTIMKRFENDYTVVYGFSDQNQVGRTLPYRPVHSLQTQ